LPRKTSEAPTRIYSFRADRPITNEDLVEHQFYLAHRYGNDLVENEHRLRDRFREIWLADPLVAEALLHYEDTCARVDDAYDWLRAAKKGVAEPDLSAPLEHLEDSKKLRDLASTELKAAKERAKERDLNLDLADPDVGPLRSVLEDARAARKAGKDSSKAEKERLKEAEKRARKDWEAARIIAEDEGRLPRDAFRLARGKTKRANHKKQRAYADAGLRHGAYIRVEKSVQQAAASTKRPLQFQSYDGTGSIGTQLTETGTRTRLEVDPSATCKGMTWGELTSGLDSNLRLGRPGEADKNPRPEIVGKTWSQVAAMRRIVRRHAARTYVDLKIGANNDKAHSPIFARFPVRLHRLPPDDAVLKWAYIVRKRVGNHYEWRFQITLESKKFDDKYKQRARLQDTCAVNLGWRRVIDAEGAVVGLRAGYALDTNGHERDIRVPDYKPDRRGGRDVPKPRARLTIKVLDVIGKNDSLAQYRSEGLERALLRLSQWLDERKGIPAEWKTPELPHPSNLPKAPGKEYKPKTMAERLNGDTYKLWRAPWKLRRFLDLWSGYQGNRGAQAASGAVAQRNRRVPGDEEILAELLKWAKDDRHLEQGLMHQQDKLIARRSEMWKVIAADLARTYATIIVGETKLPKIKGWNKKPPEEGDPSEGRLQRRMSRICAPGELRLEIQKAAAKTGARVILKEEVRATQECFLCGHKVPWNAAPSIMHTCAGPCGQTWDQDKNWCQNMLRRHGPDDPHPSSAEVPPPDERPLASKKSVKTQKDRSAPIDDAPQLGAL
jgi:hypothetical protein